jgi:hypothetical protein
VSRDAAPADAAQTAADSDEVAPGDAPLDSLLGRLAERWEEGGLDEGLDSESDERSPKTREREGGEL